MLIVVSFRDGCTQFSFVKDEVVMYSNEPNDDEWVFGQIIFFIKLQNFERHSVIQRQCFTCDKMAH